MKKSMSHGRNDDDQPKMKASIIYFLGFGDLTFLYFSMGIKMYKYIFHSEVEDHLLDIPTFALRADP